ncbi:hypothetical protein KSE_26900 [Kitasatospora setae KM-6054]|uniref:MmyB-like transcription regulator ligand binding domain-containing protein n=1 Tax=Kitasatospora setae (strain ATCC 33774 / DSM 43861 / JCM 3304 / KCC A-0304 / NBRC 14216 / KM-6054) TaxID=452652 RepID=E4NBC0_KITSK|nr:hypothetical protein KSE_26900 [Kitasatospora setae KM-6054]
MRPGLPLILDRLHDVPAQVVSDLGDALAQNPMAAAVFGDLSAVPPAARNIALRRFAAPELRTRFPAEQHEAIARAHVANLRAAHAARPEDPRIAELLHQLRSNGAEFEDLWSRHEVVVRRSSRKTVPHPAVGPLDLEREVLAAAGEGQPLLVHTARAGSEAASRLDLLRGLGAETDATRD